MVAELLDNEVVWSGIGAFFRLCPFSYKLFFFPISVRGYNRGRKTKRTEQLGVAE